MIKGCDGNKQHKNGWTKNKSKNKEKKKRKANEMKAKEHKVKKNWHSKCIKFDWKIVFYSLHHGFVLNCRS